MILKSSYNAPARLLSGIIALIIYESPSPPQATSPEANAQRRERKMNDQYDSTVKASLEKQQWQAPSVVTLQSGQTHGKFNTPYPEGYYGPGFGTGGPS